MLDFTVKRLRPEWRPVSLENVRPLMVTHEEYSIVVAADHLHVRWFLNNLLFHLEEEGRLDQWRRRWFEESYDHEGRAETEGMPIAEEARQEQIRGHCSIGRLGLGGARLLEHFE